MKIRVWLLDEKDLEMNSFLLVKQTRPHDLEIEDYLLADLWDISVKHLEPEEWVSRNGNMGQELVKCLILEELNKEILK